MVNACPVIGGFGLVVIVLIAGADAPDAPAEIARVTPFEDNPLGPFLTVTVKVPVARTAWPVICVLPPLALTLHCVLQPGPLK